MEEEELDDVSAELGDEVDDAELVLDGLWLGDDVDESEEYSEEEDD